MISHISVFFICFTAIFTITVLEWNDALNNAIVRCTNNFKHY